MIYGFHPRILTKTRDKIIIEFTKADVVPIYKEDEVYVLSDVSYDDPEQGNKPDIFKMDFNEFYANIDGDDDGWDFTGDLGYISGLSVIRH